MSELKILILKVLQDTSACGYGIVQEINERTGWEPSYGSIYPVLQKLEENRYVTGEEQKNKTLYNITEKGKQKLRNWENNSEEFFSTLQEKIKILAEMKGQDCSTILQLLERYKQGENPVKPVQTELTEFRDTIFKHCLYEDTNYETIRNLLARATNELREEL